MSAKPNRCPKCHSGKVESNKVVTHASEHTAAHHVGHHAVHHPLLAVAVGAMWLFGKAVDADSHAWVCGDCGHKFS